MPKDKPSLAEEIASGDLRRQLVALRDYVAHELEANRCRTCQMSQLRTGDTAALVLRLQKINEEIAALPPESGEVSPLDELRARRAARTPEATAPTPTAQRRQPRA